MRIARQHWMLVQMLPESGWCEGSIAVFLLELESENLPDMEELEFRVLWRRLSLGKAAE